MSSKILLTSFTTWRSHQTSNSSDDLLELIYHAPKLPYALFFQRKLPVCFHAAPEQVISQIKAIKPNAIVCCGMAENRHKLTIESQARKGDQTIYTNINLPHLIQDLTFCDISHDAGNFVCEKLYYSVLEYLQATELKNHCIFVHVPILTASNTAQVVNNFQQILHKIATQ